MKSNRMQVLPHNDEMEMACLGSILVRGKKMFIEVMSVLKPHHFYQEKHQIMFSEMLKLFNRNITINTMTLSDGLKESNLLKKCDGSYYITGLVEVTPTPSQGKFYAEQVLRDYYKREKIAFGQRLANGEEVDEKAAGDLIRNAYIINLVGKNAVKLGVDEGIIEKDHIKKIAGIPHAQAVIEQDA